MNILRLTNYEPRTSSLRLCRAWDERSMRWLKQELKHSHGDDKLQLETSTVEEIISAIEQLSDEDRAESARRLNWEEYEWVRQIAADFKAGKFDKMIAAATADAKAGRTRDLS